MRVLVISDGTWGDVSPFLTVARDLVRECGHEVLAIVNPSFGDAAEELGLSHINAGQCWDTHDATADPAIMRPGFGTIRVLRRYLVPEIPDWVRATREALETFRPDVAFVHHLSWGPLWAAHRADVRVRAGFLAPLSLFSSVDPGHAIPSVRWTPPCALTRINFRLMRMILRWLLDRPARDAWRRAELPPPRDLLFLAREITRAPLGLWSPAFRGPAADDPPGLRICGYAFPDEGDPEAPLDDGLEAFLDAGDPPVVVTLGTSARQVGLDLYQEAARACRLAHRRGILLMGSPASTPEPLPDGVRAFDHAPHGKLMARACAIVHHGGAGTTAQALRSGRPAIIIPFGHDQFDNAYRSERLAGSRVLRRSRARAERVAAALVELLADETLLARAGAVGEQVAAERGSLAAARAIEELTAD
jgi:UDP:flavonoid glycosyltransferase YjiC (YdhE family)